MKNGLLQIDADFEGNAFAASIPLPADEIVRLPPNPCRFVKIYNWNVGDDSAFTAKATIGDPVVEDDLQEIYYGFNGVFCGQIFPGRETELLPVQNTRMITLRGRPGQSSIVYFAWFS